MTPFTVFDIETQPANRELLDELKPEFKPNSSYKKAEAIANSIAEKEADYYEKAALSPFYSRVLVIGMMLNDGTPVYLEGEESEILETFWRNYEDLSPHKFCFWSGSGSSKQFDIDFIVTRSRILGVTLPLALRNGRYYSARVFDLAAEFLLHAPEAYLTLSHAAKIIGLFGEGSVLRPKGKNDEVQGGNFHLWYRGLASTSTLPEQRAKALSYLGNDLALTAAIARRILC